MQVDDIFFDFLSLFLFQGKLLGDVKDSQYDDLPFVFLIALGHLDRVRHVFFEVQNHIIIHRLTSLLAVYYQFAQKVFTFLDDLEIRAVEVDVDELICPDEGLLDYLVLISLETYQLAVFVQPQEKHLQAVVHSKREPSTNQTHQDVEKDEVNALLGY